MSVDFCDYFWGEEHVGWNVLYQNMRLGQTAAKELSDFFKEKGSIDENYAKALNKLSQKIGGGSNAAGNTPNWDRWGTFAPLFSVLRGANEQLASVHLSVVAKLQDLVKDLNKYQEQTHRKHKQVKDEESHTEDIVKNIQATGALAQKAKESYSQRCQDLEKVKRDGASPKDLEKAEMKLKKSYDEYKNLLEKYNNIRDEFEKSMTVSCKRFQDVEDSHLTRLLVSVREFVRLLGSSSGAIVQINQDLHRHYSKHSVLTLLDAFALAKLTGLEKPVPMVLEDSGSLGSGVSGQQSPDLGSSGLAGHQSVSSLQHPDQQSSKSSAEDMTSVAPSSGGVLTADKPSTSQGKFNNLFYRSLPPSFRRNRHRPTLTETKKSSQFFTPESSKEETKGNRVDDSYNLVELGEATSSTDCNSTTGQFSSWANFEDDVFKPTIKKFPLDAISEKSNRSCDASFDTSLTEKCDSGSLSTGAEGFRSASEWCHFDEPKVTIKTDDSDVDDVFFDAAESVDKITSQVDSSEVESKKDYDPWLPKSSSDVDNNKADEALKGPATFPDSPFVTFEEPPNVCSDNGGLDHEPEAPYTEPEALSLPKLTNLLPVVGAEGDLPSQVVTSDCDVPGYSTGAEEQQSCGEEKDATMSRSILSRSSKWFLRNRNQRKKEKKNKKKKDESIGKEEKSDNELSEDIPRTTELLAPTEDHILDSSLRNSSVTTSAQGDGSLLSSSGGLMWGDNSLLSSSSGSAITNSNAATALVDEEGYTIRPNEPTSGQSSSGSDSDEEIERPIHVSIKPLSNGSSPVVASVDQIRATVQNITLNNRPSGRRSGYDSSDGGLRRSSSTTNNLNSTKSGSADLLGLNLNFGTPDTNTTSPAGVVSDTNPGGSPSLSSGGVNNASDRYKDFSEVMTSYNSGGSGTDNTPPPSIPPRGAITPTSTIPRPHSKRQMESRGRSNSPALTSTLSMSRAESASSLDWKSPQIGGSLIGSSRGPSPLTLGMSDAIPLAIAFQEFCHVYFRGADETKCQLKISGEMMVSFPAGIVSVLTSRPMSSPPLSFTLINAQNCDLLRPNTELIERTSIDEHNYSFIMPTLTNLLRKQAEQSPSASYFNVDIIKYQVSDKWGADNTPLQLVSYWKCEENVTELRVDYRYNPSALPTPSPPLSNVTLSTMVDGLVTAMHSKPQGQWIKDQQKAVWKLGELSTKSTPPSGSLRAKFEVSAGPSTPSTINAMFTCEGTNLTGMDFELLGTGYRLSLVKKRFVTGKYICDADAVLKLRYGGPPPT